MSHGEKKRFSRLDAKMTAKNMTSQPPLNASSMLATCVQSVHATTNRVSHLPGCHVRKPQLLNASHLPDCHLRKSQFLNAQRTHLQSTNALTFPFLIVLCDLNKSVPGSVHRKHAPHSSMANMSHTMNRITSCVMIHKRMFKCPRCRCRHAEVQTNLDTWLVNGNRKGCPCNCFVECLKASKFPKC